MQCWYGGDMKHYENCDDPGACEAFECDCCMTETLSCRIARVASFCVETFACDDCRGEVKPQEGFGG